MRTDLGIGAVVEERPVVIGVSYRWRDRVKRGSNSVVRRDIGSHRVARSIELCGESDETYRQDRDDKESRNS